MSRDSKLSAEGQLTRDALQRAYAGESVRIHAMGSADLGTLDVTVELFKGEIDRAKKEFDAWDFVQARDRFRKVAENADRVTPRTDSINEVRMRARTGSAAAMLNLQEMTAARQLLDEVDERSLTEKQRCNLSIMLAQLGDIGRATAIATKLPDSSGDVIAAKQIVSIARGETTIGEARTAIVALKLSEKHLEHGQASLAAAVAIQWLDACASGDLVENGLVCTLMNACCVTLVEQCKPEGKMSLSQLHAALLILDRYAPRSSLPEQLRVAYVDTAVAYAQCAIDHRLFWRLKEQFPADYARVISVNTDLLAADLAKNGSVTDAIGLVAGDAAEWQVQARRLHFLSLGGDARAASQGLTELAAQFPGRFPLEALASEVALQQTRLADALRHAENAFALYPSIGARLLVARCALASGNSHRALAVAADQDVSNDETFLWVLGHAADRVSDPRALDFWAAYLRLRPESSSGTISWALALNRAGELERAADATIDVVGGAPEGLRIEELVACGQLQLAAAPTPERKARVRRVADLILERFGTDPEVQLQRFMLLAGIGEQHGVKIDFERLSATGHVQSVSLDELLATVDVRAKRAEAAINLYRNGCLTVEAFIRVTGGRTASFISEVLAGRAQLRTSMLVRDREDRIVLSGRRVLVSLIELVLFEHLGVFDQVVELLGDGKLVVFHDVWTQIVDDAVFLQQMTQIDEAERLRSVAARIATCSKYEILRTDESGAGIARAVPCVHLSEGEHDIGWLAGVLIAKAAAPLDDARAFARAHARPVLSVDADTISATVQLDQAVIEGLIVHGLLQAVEDTFDRILVGAGSMRTLESRRGRLDSDLSAMRLMQAVKRSTSRGRARGALEVVDRPRVPALEALPKDEEKEEWTRTSVREPMAYKQWLIDERESARVTAEYVGSLMPFHPELWITLPWPSREVAHATWSAFRDTEEREWTLVELVRELPDTVSRRDALARLGELGFQDALEADELALIADRYGRLDIGKGGAFLDRVEGLIAGPQDPWAALARMRLSATYASTIWKFVEKGDASRASQLARELLGRAARLGVRSSARTPEVLIGHLLLLAISNPELSIAGEEVVTLRKTGALVDVWNEIRLWSDDHDERTAACRRALSYGWEKLHQYTEGGPPSMLTWAPLALATDKLVPGTSFERVPNPDAVAAILSALWVERPLRARTANLADGSRINVEELLEVGTRRMAERAVRGIDESTACFFVDVAGGTSVEILVPVEALLLRAESVDLRSGFANDLAGIVGSIDGRLYERLTCFAENPNDREAQAALALAACTSPYRLVRDDASIIACWGEHSTAGQQGYPASFDDLCELLSEPKTFEGRPDREVKDRVEHGHWSNRRDVGDLMLVAGRVPGPSVARIATAVVKRPPSGMWDEILRVMGGAATVPIGRLAQGVALAALAPFYSQQAVEQNVLDDGLRSVLAQLDSDDEFVRGEGRCIALLERVIRRLAGARPVPRQQFIWLTFRLYEWWCENSTLEQRLEASKNEAGANSWGAFRWSVVLNILLDVCEMVSIASRKRPEHLGVLTEYLVKRATNEPWESDPFGVVWGRPQGGGWLAASILLWISPAHFMQLPPEIRLRVFENLPVETVSLAEQVLPHMSFVDGIVSNVQNLSEEETRAVNTWLAKLGESDTAQLWRLHIWSRFLARGDESNHEALRSIVDVEARGKRHVEFVSQYVSSLVGPALTDEALRDAVAWLTSASANGGQVADGFLAAWRTNPASLDPLKLALSSALLAQPDELSQVAGASIRDTME